MLSHCANTRCSKPFLRLREGKLFLVETDRAAKSAPASIRGRHQQHHVERFWLCDDCAMHWTLVYDHDRGVELTPLRQPVRSAPGASAATAAGVA